MLGARPAVVVAAVKLDTPGVRHFLDQGAQKGALACAVEADQRSDTASRQCGVDPFEDSVAAQRDTKILDRHQIRIHGKPLARLSRACRIFLSYHSTLFNSFASSLSSCFSAVSKGSISTKTISLSRSFMASRNTLAEVSVGYCGSTAM